MTPEQRAEKEINDVCITLSEADLRKLLVAINSYEPLYILLPDGKRYIGVNTHNNPHLKPTTVFGVWAVGTYAKSKT